MRKILWFGSTRLLLSAVVGLAALDSANGAEDLFDMDLEQLMAVEIASVSRRTEALTDTAAAVTVLTAEQIRRSGAATIPDLLRTVPGVYVAQINASKWVISFRGFGTRFSRGVLILIDGRDIYRFVPDANYHAGLDVPLSQIKRIEIIRGPGGTLWGDNATNGVINIITRDATEDRGGALEMLAGQNSPDSISVRQGGVVTNNLMYQAYADRTTQSAGLVDAPKNNAEFDQWQSTRAGAELVWSDGGQDQFRFRLDANDSHLGRGSFGNWFIPKQGANVNQGTTEISQTALQGNWQHRWQEGQELELESRYSWVNNRGLLIRERRQQFDLDAKYQQQIGRHNLITGIGFRRIYSKSPENPAFGFQPPKRTEYIYSGFIDDEFKLSQKLTAEFGARLEQRNRTGFQVQPTARLLFDSSPTLSFWGAVTRAVRSPSRMEEDLAMQLDFGSNPLPTVLVSRNGPEFGNETSLSFEWGARWQARSNLRFDLATYYNDYDDLIGVVLGTPTLTGGTIIIPSTGSDSSEAKIWGGELAAEWQINSTAQLRASYSHSELSTQFSSDSHSARKDEGINFYWPDTTPANLFSAILSLDLPKETELDTTVRFVDQVDRLNIEQYWTLDLRLGVPLTADLSLELIGRNLLDPDHLETIGDLYLAAQTERSLFARLKLTWN
ncbi:MAG: TonB-dependent receptor [Gammaproteobacteria bacterium]|nr:TonB-dependent receptor [Gammaproteobacteria bacterium]